MGISGGDFGISGYFGDWHNLYSCPFCGHVLPQPPFMTEAAFNEALTTWKEHFVMHPEYHEDADE